MASDEESVVLSIKQNLAKGTLIFSILPPFFLSQGRIQRATEDRLMFPEIKKLFGSGTHHIESCLVILTKRNHVEQKTEQQHAHWMTEPQSSNVV